MGFAERGASPLQYLPRSLLGSFPELSPFYLASSLAGGAYRPPHKTLGSQEETKETGNISAVKDILKWSGNTNLPTKMTSEQNQPSNRAYLQCINHEVSKDGAEEANQR